MPRLEKSRQVLDVFIDKGITVLFTRDPDEPEDVPSQLRIDRNTWIDMGKPKVVTVTVEPGDLMNA